MRTALVTGGAGFIGSHIVDQLLQREINVVVMDDLSTGDRNHLFHKDIIFYQADICSRTSVEEILQVHNPHVIFHCAAQISVSRSVREPAHDATVNVVGLLNLLEESVRVGVERFVFSSSGGVMYGEAPNAFPTPENQTEDPVSPYGIAKWVGEKYLDFFHQHYGLEYAALRYGNVYGPRQNPHGEAGVVAIFCEKMLKNVTPIIHGDGSCTRDYVFVEDVALANILAMDAQGVFVGNIGTGIGTSVNDLYRILQSMIPNTPEAIHGPPREGDLLRSQLDSTRAKEVLGWESTTSLEHGFSQTVDYFQSKLGL
jgi:UDP-glucose 4-epimerase